MLGGQSGKRGSSRQISSMQCVHNGKGAVSKWKMEQKLKQNNSSWWIQVLSPIKTFTCIHQGALSCYNTNHDLFGYLYSFSSYSFTQLQGAALILLHLILFMHKAKQIQKPPTQVCFKQSSFLTIYMGRHQPPFFLFRNQFIRC